MNDQRPVLIMAGGTGGHVFPGLAIARVLRERGVPVLWLGTRQGLEARLVPAAGIPIEWLTVRGLRNKGLLGWLMAPLRILRGMLQATRILRRHRPRVVLGLGGYVAGPGGLAAWLLRRPLVLHEQNAIAGLTNRLLSRLARRVLCGFPGAFPAARGSEVVGNPVRPEILALPGPAERKPAVHRPMRLLVVGGSLGARILNETVPAAVARLPGDIRPEIRHQAGEATLDVAEDGYARHQVTVQVMPFIDDMAAAYGWADLVLCRAGALTVSELAAAGRPAILVPLPHAVDDHQTANARYLSDNGGGWLLPQHELDPDRLAGLLRRAATEPETIADMAARARHLARPDAAERVADACLEVA